MFGNVMWRLAIHTVKWEAVYAGPSGWSLDPSEMLVVRDANGVEYIDDKLSPQEQEALCGTYHCFTGGSAFCRVFFLTLLRKWNLKGKGSQFALKSWYMPPKTAERSNQDIGRWSTHSELIFNLLDKTFSNSESQSGISISRQPHTRSKWENHARSSLDIKRARLRMEEVSAKKFEG
jgi:hypothetical protein